MMCWNDNAMHVNYMKITLEQWNFTPCYQARLCIFSIDWHGLGSVCKINKNFCKFDQFYYFYLALNKKRIPNKSNPCPDINDAE